MSIEAGRLAWRIGVDIDDNPYKKEPGRSLWLKGWKEKQKEFDQKRKRFDKRPIRSV